MRGGRGSLACIPAMVMGGWSSRDAGGTVRGPGWGRWRELRRMMRGRRRRRRRRTVEKTNTLTGEASGEEGGRIDCAVSARV